MQNVTSPATSARTISIDLSRLLGAGYAGAKVGAKIGAKPT